MMDWLERLNANPIPWLLEEDPTLPSVRYLALRDLLQLPPSDPELVKAQADVMSSGPVPTILSQQADEGYWEKPGPGYASKYTGTVWQVIMLAQLGADGRDPRMRAACEYVLTHSCASCGGFSMTGTAGGLLHCLQGNLCASLLDLGYGNDHRLQQALDWRAVSQARVSPLPMMTRRLYAICAAPTVRQVSAVPATTAYLAHGALLKPCWRWAKRSSTAAHRPCRLQSIRGSISCSLAIRQPPITRPVLLTNQVVAGSSWVCRSVT